jgi:hypothetical protein
MTDDERMSRRMFLRGGATVGLRDVGDARAKTGVFSGGERMSRRVFIGGGVGVAGVALLGAAPPAWARRVVADTRSALAARPTSLTRSLFEPILGATLRVGSRLDSVEVVLAEITDLSPVLRADDPHRFALLLHAHGSHRRVSGIRTIHHDDLGDVTLFVSPVGRAVRPAHYEVIINNRSRL